MKKIFHNIFSFFFTSEAEETLELVLSYRDKNQCPIENVIYSGQLFGSGSYRRDETITSDYGTNS